MHLLLQENTYSQVSVPRFVQNFAVHYWEVLMGQSSAVTFKLLVLHLRVCRTSY
jgi:hypothetical protein